MRISAAFPSQFLKASDLQGRRVRVVMSHVSMDDVGGEPKPILFFQGKEKGLPLNKTNANSIASYYGDDTDAWAGHPLELFESMVDFQGRTVAAIRVHAPRAAAQSVAMPIHAPAQATPMAAPVINGAMPTAGSHGRLPVGTVVDDEIPF